MTVIHEADCCVSKLYIGAGSTEATEVACIPGRAEEIRTEDGCVGGWMILFEGSHYGDKNKSASMVFFRRVFSLFLFL